MTEAPLVRIHYRRPPDREEIFRQRLVLDHPSVKVTLARDLTFDPPIRIHRQVALETGSDAVWFTFPGLWHDIGRFHRADGTFTGVYANILTPVEIREEGVWYTTDLYLDLWIPARGNISVLDRDHLEEALHQGWISPAEARRARAEVERLLEAHGQGDWPPAVVEEWTRKRALAKAEALPD